MKWLLYLYPKSWREQYGDEFLFILEQRKLSAREIVDVVWNAIDARILLLAEGVITMDHKVRDFMLKSTVNRLFVFTFVIGFGLLGGYWLSSNTPPLSDFSPQALLLLGVGIGLFIGYAIGFARGIMRVINVTQKADVSLPTGKLIVTKLNPHLSKKE
jgi:hypothetical protein